MNISGPEHIVPGSRREIPPEIVKPYTGQQINIIGIGTTLAYAMVAGRHQALALAAQVAQLGIAQDLSGKGQGLVELESNWSLLLC